MKIKSTSYPVKKPVNKHLVNKEFLHPRLTDNIYQQHVATHSRERVWVI